MRILVATFTYWPNVDGVAAAAEQMVKTFQSFGHDVVVVTGACQAVPDNSTQLDQNTYRFSVSGNPAFGTGFSGEIAKYQDLILSLDFDLIVFHCWDTWPCELALPLRRKIRSRLILVSHGYASHILNPRILPRGLWKWVRWLPQVSRLPLRIRQFDKVVFLSNKSDWGRFLDVRVARFCKSPNISFIPNGIPELATTKPGEFRKQYNILNRTFFLCIANYSIRKNQERALRAFASAAIRDATLVFIGSKLGEYGERLTTLWKQIKSAGALGDVIFLEGLTRNQTLAALHDCDVKVLAADAETQPIVLLEAMAASKPFISTNTGCVEEFKGGIIVSDTSEMTATMLRLSNFPAERQRLGKEGRLDYEANYSLERTSNAWSKLLLEITRH